MEDDTDRVAPAGSHSAYAVTQIDAIRAAGALHGAMTDSKKDCIAL